MNSLVVDKKHRRQKLGKTLCVVASLAVKSYGVDKLDGHAANDQLPGFYRTLGGESFVDTRKKANKKNNNNITTKKKKKTKSSKYERRSMWIDLNDNDNITNQMNKVKSYKHIFIDPDIFKT